jgi:uncharacterized membrane protein YraQ (UPF0718 family)
MTYALMDLPMTIIRPLAAFLTATCAGLLNYYFNKETSARPRFTSLKEEDCDCDHDHSHSHEKKATTNKFRIFYNFVFHELIDDLAKWVLLGIVLGAMIDYFLPANILGQLNGFGGKILMIVIGVPLYICASSTTPIAAGLIMKGMSPGTAIILLLTGPATNISTLVVMQNYIGKKGVILNAISIAVVSLAISFLVDFLYRFYAWPLNFKIAEIHSEDHFGNWSQVTSVLLILLIFKGLYSNWKERKKA